MVNRLTSTIDGPEKGLSARLSKRYTVVPTAAADEEKQTAPKQQEKCAVLNDQYLLIPVERTVAGEAQQTDKILQGEESQETGVSPPTKEQ